MGIIILTTTHRFEPRTLNCNPKHPKTFNSNQKSYIPIKKFTWIPNQNFLPATRNRKFSAKNVDFGRRSPLPRVLLGFLVFLFSRCLTGSRCFRSPCAKLRRRLTAHLPSLTGLMLTKWYLLLATFTKLGSRGSRISLEIRSRSFKRLARYSSLAGIIVPNFDWAHQNCGSRFLASQVRRVPGTQHGRRAAAAGCPGHSAGGTKSANNLVRDLARPRPN